SLVFPSVGKADKNRSARKRDFDRSARFGVPERFGGGGGGAGPASAGESRSGSPLPDAHEKLRFREDFDEFDVRSVRKQGMIFNLRTDLREIDPGHLRSEEDGVRISQIDSHE